MNLPYITTPKAPEKVQVGNETIGVLEITKLKDLSPNERRWLKAETKHLPNLRQSAAQMSRRIAADEGKPMLEVYNALTSGNTAYLENHLDEVLNFQDLMEVVAEQRSLYLATMVIKFRLLPEWTIDNTGNADLISPELVREVSLFAAKEESGWAEPEAAEELTEADLGKLLNEAEEVDPDWAAIYWRLQRYWAHDLRFSSENFGFQPTWLILQALEQGAKLHAEELHHQELGIATLSALFCNANRDPKKGEPAKPSDFWYFEKAEASGVAIPGSVCDVFFSLVADNLLPAWALGVAPIELLRRHRANKPVIKPRAWIGENLILIQPHVSSDGKTVTAAMALNNGAVGGVELQDVDSGTSFYLLLEEPGQVAWALSAEFERVNHE